MGAKSLAKNDRSLEILNTLYFRPSALFRAGVSMSRNSMVRLNNHPDMTIAVYHGHKTTTV